MEKDYRPDVADVEEDYKPDEADVDQIIPDVADVEEYMNNAAGVG